MLLGLRLDEPLPLAGLDGALDRDALERLERPRPRRAAGDGTLALTRRGRFLGGGVTAELLGLSSGSSSDADRPGQRHLELRELKASYRGGTGRGRQARPRGEEARDERSEAGDVRPFRLDLLDRRAAFEDEARQPERDVEGRVADAREVPVDEQSLAVPDAEVVTPHVEVQQRRLPRASSGVGVARAVRATPQPSHAAGAEPKSQEWRRVTRDFLPGARRLVREAPKTAPAAGVAATSLERGEDRVDGRGRPGRGPVGGGQVFEDEHGALAVLPAE